MTCLVHTPSTGPVPADATVTIGYDPGYTINPSGVVVLRHGLDKNEPYAEVLLATRWYQMPVSEQQQRLLALVDEYQAHRVVMDAGGAEAVAQGLRPRLGKRLVEQQVAPKMLRTTADTIDYLISRGRLAVPDPALRAEIGQVELDGENIHLPSIVPSPRPHPKAVDHSDMYVGLALASTQVHRPSTPVHTPTNYVRQATLHRAATVGRR